jgi:hypothetical protein
VDSAAIGALSLCNRSWSTNRMTNTDREVQAERAGPTTEPFAIVLAPKIPRTSEGTMSEDAAAAYITWLTQTDVTPRLLGEWRNRQGVGPDYFQPKGTKIVTYEKKHIDTWFWGSKREMAA